MLFFVANNDKNGSLLESAPYKSLPKFCLSEGSHVHHSVLIM